MQDFNIIIYRYNSISKYNIKYIHVYISKNHNKYTSAWLSIKITTDSKHTKV